MDRPGGVVATVVLLAIGGLLCLGMAALMAFSFLLLRQGGNPSNVELPMWVLIFPVALFGGLAAWVLITAVGVWKLRPWGRISVLIFSGVLVFMQGFGMLIVLFLFPQDEPAVSQRSMWMVRAGFGLFYGIQVAIGIWWLVYFNRAKVKALFAGNAPVSDRPACPLSITVIAWHYAVGGVACLAIVCFDWPALFFGVIWRGVAAKIVYLAIGSISAFLGIALLKLHPKAVDWSLGYLGIMLVGALPFWFAADQEQLMREMLAAMPIKGISENRPIPVMPTWLSVTIGATAFAVPLWYLVTRKAAYLAASQAAASQPAAPPAL